MPGVICVKEETEIAHEHVPASIIITARSRKLLTDGILWSRDAAYCDTDCIVTQRDDMPCSKELGQYKLERFVKAGRFLAPKLYELAAIHDDEIKKLQKENPIWKWKGWEHPESEAIPKTFITKSKGFSRLGHQGFQLVEAGWKASIDRMWRPREMLRRGQRGLGVEAGSRMVPKGIRTGVEKRAFSADGSVSRPFTVAEIHEITAKGLIYNAASDGLMRKPVDRDETATWMEAEMEDVAGVG
jgi:hypothetical protein